MRKLFSTKVRIILVAALLLTAGLAILSSTGQHGSVPGTIVQVLMSPIRAVGNALTDTAEKTPEKAPKKAFTTPLKEKSRRERNLKKAEENVAKLENEMASIEEALADENNQSDYIKLGELQSALAKVSADLDEAMILWEEAAASLAEIE